MPMAKLKQKRKRARAALEALFPRTEARVECQADRMMRRPPVDRMLKADRHVTKRALREITERPESAYVHD